MGGYRARGLTNGFLPEAAFLHLEATAIGYVDLEAPLNVSYPAPESGAGDCRDSLLLVRLHNEPIAVVHVDGPLQGTSSATLANAIWEGCAAEISRHCEQFACRQRPHRAEELIGGLAAGADGCRGQHPASDRASVTVVIPTCGRPLKLTRCLRTLCDLDFGSFDVVVVDNCPQTPGTRDVVAAFRDRLSVRYVAEPRPGSSVARNRGLAETESEFVVFADDDVLVDSGWLGWLMDPFADPSVRVVTGMILPRELQSESQKRLEQYAGFSKGVERRTYDLGKHRARNRLLYPYWGGIFGSGASMAFRRASLVSLGGFDPALGAGSPARGGADIEAFTAAILHGGSVVYEPRSVCWHEHTRDPGALRRTLFDYGVGFTAVLTKYLTHDVRFLTAVARSIPLALSNRRNRRSTEPSRLPQALARVERRGMLRGPWLYTRSRRWAHKLRLGEVIEQR
jgi:glycosyltransferase involved in cell wall biosynthesis